MWQSLSGWPLAVLVGGGLIALLIAVAIVGSVARKLSEVAKRGGTAGERTGAGTGHDPQSPWTEGQRYTRRDAARPPR